MSFFSPKQLADIATARSKMNVVHDPEKRELLVSWSAGGRPVSGGWFLFAYDRPDAWRPSEERLTVERISSTARCQSCITGVERAEDWEHWFANAAWEVARAAMIDLDKEKPVVDDDGGDSSWDFVVPIGSTTPPPSRITTAVQWFLAVKSRVDEWGGFEREKNSLPGLYASLIPEDRRAVDDRLAGKVVL